MDVSAPITAAVPGVAGLVIAALLPTTAPKTETEIARACPSVSHPGVHKALRRLEGTGVVLRVPGGFLLNRDHLVFPALELLDGLYGRLRSRIGAASEAWGRDVRCLGLFGSAARRDGDSASDIDVLLVSDDPQADDFAIELSDDIQRWTGNPSHVMTLTSKELRRMKRAKEPIVESWAEELDPIVGSLAAAMSTQRDSST